MTTRRDDLRPSGHRQMPAAVMAYAFMVAGIVVFFLISRWPQDARSGRWRSCPCHCHDWLAGPPLARMAFPGLCGRGRHRRRVRGWAGLVGRDPEWSHAGATPTALNAPVRRTRTTTFVASCSMTSRSSPPPPSRQAFPLITETPEARTVSLPGPPTRQARPYQQRQTPSRSQGLPSL